jgi:GT2 family glycosyltransferase
LTRAAAVVPNWNGRRWLPACLASLEGFSEVLVVDNGSTDGSLEWLRAQPGVRVIALSSNLGFAAAANRGIAAVDADAVALVNTDVELSEGWLERMLGALGDGVGSVACKMVSSREDGVLDDCGDFLRRDGACEQRGRGRVDDGRWDVPGEVFSACAGAALYRRSAVLEVGGFDERFFSYLEDVDLGLRLRLAGWRCAYEPAVARHWGGGSSGQLARPVPSWVERNTLLLCARAFPLRWWLGPVAYRQVAWAVAAARERRLGTFARGVWAALPLLPAFVRERRSLPRARSIGEVVDARPWRGPAAGGHPRAPY